MKIRNIIFIAYVLVALLLTVNTMSYADTINPDYFKPGEVQTSGATEAIELGQKIIGVITTVGTVVAVVATMGMGIKYMVGSIEQRAEYKKTMMPMLIGMLLLFGVSWIVKLIYDIVSNVNV